MHDSALKARAITLALSTLASCLAFSAFSAAYGTSILMIGDSITFGISSSPVGPGYADLVIDDLGGTHSITRVGCGFSGAFSWWPNSGPTTCVGVTQEPLVLFDAFVRPNAPVDIATVMLGTNDAFLGIGGAEYRALLLQLFDGLQGVGADIIVAMTPPPRPGLSSNAQLLTQEYADIISNPANGLCRTTPGVICGPDVFRLLDVEIDFGVQDIHPNAFGHAKIAHAVVESILAIPEPSTACLVFLGLLALARRSSRGDPGARRRLLGPK